MLKNISHHLKMIFGRRVTDEGLSSLATDISYYVSSFGEQLSEALDKNDLYVGGRERFLRREFISFFAFYASTYVHDDQTLLPHAQRLIDGFKSRYHPTWDVSRERVTIPTGVDDSGYPTHITAEKHSNVLEATINDRLDFYARGIEAGEDPRAIMIVCFAWAYVLQRPVIGGLNLQQATRTILENPGRKVMFRGRSFRVQYPDEIRDEFIAQWVSNSLGPIKKQFDDYFYAAKHRRIP